MHTRAIKCVFYAYTGNEIFIRNVHVPRLEASICAIELGGYDQILKLKKLGPSKESTLLFLLCSTIYPLIAMIIATNR